MAQVPLSLRALPSVAYRAWFTPPPLGRRAAGRDASVMLGVEPLRISRPDGGDVIGFQTGFGPLVLAIHGWGGRAAQMVPLAKRLASEGYRVVGVDLPGRGGSDRTDIKQVASAIRQLIEAAGEPEVIVAHSFGALALRLALGDRIPPVVVLLAPAVRVADIFGVFADRARLLPWTRASLWRRLSAWDDGMISDFDARYSDQFPGAEVLILHDPADDETPFLGSAELAERRPGTKLVKAEGAGHFGVLDNPDVLDTVAALVGRARSARQTASLIHEEG